LLFTFFTLFLVTLISEIVSSEVDLTDANYKVIDQTLHNNIPRHNTSRFETADRNRTFLNDNTPYKASDDSSIDSKGMTFLFR